MLPESLLTYAMAPHPAISSDFSNQKLYQPFGNSDVEKTIFEAEGKMNEDSWFCVAKLIDGRYAYISMKLFCSGINIITQSGICYTANKLNEIVQYALTDNERDRWPNIKSAS